MKRMAVKTPWFWIFAALALAGPAAILSWSPAEVEGSNMPGKLVINSLQDRYGPVVFDHELHAAMAEGCGTCHHSHDEKRNATCRECHSLSAHAFKASAGQGFLACSSCHADYSPEMPGMPGLKVAYHKKCFQCHVGLGELGTSPAGCAKTCHSRV